MSEKAPYTVTAALPYANGPLHLGHIAGVYLPADIFVRFLRMNHEDVVFVCGSDEHGAAITLRAKKEGKKPEEIVEQYHNINKKAFNDFDIDFDIYHRTSSEIHHKTAQEWFLNLHEKGAFTEETSEQFYDEEHEQFLADRYVTGTCPKCGYENAYGDQCEKCGSSLSSNELIDPKSVLSGKPPVMKTTSHWYLPLDRHEEWLRSWIKEGTLEGKQLHDPKLWRNQVVGQCLSWIDGGLRSRAMTRDLDWGVKVPLKGADGKVLYVWLDAPIGYVSATKQWAQENGKDWEKYWKNDARLVHFIGKDNIVFHCIIFPVLLKEHDDFVLPENVPAYEFLNLEGDKFSTSRNWAVWLHEYMADHPDKKDELRYVLTSIAPESKDSEFTWKDFQSRVNNELVAILGNFLNRAMVLTHKYYGGTVPGQNGLTVEDKSILEQLSTYPKELSVLIRGYRLREAQQMVMNMARLGNKYLADNEPWKIQKTDPNRVETIMNVALQIAANVSVALYPFMPEKSKAIQQQLNINETDWSVLGRQELVSSGHQINKSSLLFQKIEDEWVEKEIEKLKESQKIETTAPQQKQIKVKENIDFETFMKMDIKVGTIKAAERVPKTDKLLQLEVDLGFETRTIVSGIAEHYSPEDTIDKKVSVLVNLEPRKIRGVVSQGMILMAENEEGKLSFVSPEKAFESGAEIR